MIKDLRKDEYSDFYQTYIDALPKEHVGLIENLNFSKKEALALLTKLAEDKHEYVYAEGKWTIKEIMQHIIDAERVFNYRALRIARGDTTNLHGFNENDFVANSNTSERDFFEIMKEFISLRNTTIFLYESLTQHALLNTGMVSSNSMSVRALGFITSGHLIHHLRVIKNRYL